MTLVYILLFVCIALLLFLLRWGNRLVDSLNRITNNRLDEVKQNLTDTILDSLKETSDIIIDGTRKVMIKEVNEAINRPDYWSPKQAKFIGEYNKMAEERDEIKEILDKTDQVDTYFLRAIQKYLSNIKEVNQRDKDIRQYIASIFNELDFRQMPRMEYLKRIVTLSDMMSPQVNKKEEITKPQRHEKKQETRKKKK